MSATAGVRPCASMLPATGACTGLLVSVPLLVKIKPDWGVGEVAWEQVDEWVSKVRV